MKKRSSITIYTMPILIAVLAALWLVIAPAEVFATFSNPGSGVAKGDDRIYEAARRLFLLIEGNFGALIMVCAGLASLIAAAFSQYRKAISLLVVAAGAFILRSLVVIFFDFK